MKNMKLVITVEISDDGKNVVAIGDCRGSADERMRMIAIKKLSEHIMKLSDSSIAEYAEKIFSFDSQKDEESEE